MFSDVSEPGITGCEFGPGVADADHRSAVEDVRGKALGFHPTSMNEAILVFRTVALDTSQRLFICRHGSNCFVVREIIGPTLEVSILYDEYTMQARGRANRGAVQCATVWLS